MWVLRFSITFNLSCPGKSGPPVSDSYVYHSCAAVLLGDPRSSGLVLSWLPCHHFTGFPDLSGASARHSRHALQRAQLKLPAKHQPNCPTRWFMNDPDSCFPTSTLLFLLWTHLGHPSSVPLILDALGDMLIPSLGQEMPSLKCHLCFGGWPDHLMVKACSLNSCGSFSWH